jgi:mono/diheme cytochrome c family protein
MKSNLPHLLALVLLGPMLPALAQPPPILPARTVEDTKLPAFQAYQPKAEAQTIEHPHVVANFRLHLEYRLPSTAARLSVRVHPSLLVDLPAGKAKAWRVLDLQFEQLTGKPASLLATVDGKIIANQPAVAASLPAQLTEQNTFPGGITGVPTTLSLTAIGAAEIRQAWLQPLSDTAHAELIVQEDEPFMARGKLIFTTLCATCHGTATQEGSMPTSRKLHKEALKNGTDPFRLFQTITQGYGQMMPLPIPAEDRYAVIQYLRSEILRPDNPTQFFAVDDPYLAALPRPMRTLAKAAPVDETPFYLKMDFGPVLHWTYQVSPDNIAFKGIAVRLDPGAGGVSKGRAWMLYDHDTMRVAAAWSGGEFIDWKGIAFDATHQTHASIVGDTAWENPSGPGWADPATGQWTDPREPGRDGRRHGPMPRQWMQYRGLHLHSDRAVLSYTVGTTSVLDSPGMGSNSPGPVFTRSLNIGPSTQTLALRVAPEGSGVALRGDGGSLVVQDGFTVLQLPPSAAARSVCLYIVKGRTPDPLTFSKADNSPLDLSPLTLGGAPRWPLTVTTQAEPGKDDAPFAVDTLTLPDENPWNAMMRIGAFDFLPDGRSAALCTWNGDVWTVSGLGAKPTALQWKRIASGLFQPLGLKVVRGDIYLTCRDQLAVLRDRNGDGEADFIECFNNDAQVTEHFHEFAMGLQSDAAGNFYYAKSACHARPAVVSHHGTLLKVSADGARTDILANGFRAANGVCLNPDGSFFVTDQEGHWTPKNRINHVIPDGGFYGNMLGYSAVTDKSDAAMRQPLCWITNAKDRSPAELLWVPPGVWGNLGGSLLNTSYGYGRLYAVPHESSGGIWQGGMVELPIPDFPTGIMRARFHPVEGQLYTSGCSVWASNCLTAGGFYRVRYNGQGANVPIKIRARPDGVALTFSGPLDAKAALEGQRFKFRTWQLARSEKYGSAHQDEKPSRIAKTTLLDPATVLVEVENLKPTQCYALKYELSDASGKAFTGELHGTIHQLVP